MNMLNDVPLVTVYMPCHNYGVYLAQSINSVCSQLYPNWELYIIDEGSDDDTSSIARTMVQANPSRIHLIHHEQPLGLQKSANEVLGLAKGRYIVRLDADDWFDESALLLMVAKLESNPNLGLVYGNYYYTNSDGEVIGVERRRKLGIEDRSGHLPPHGACTMVRTRLLKSVGGYSEDVDAQDGWELWFKLTNHMKAASIDAPLFYYRQHEQSLSKDSSRLLNARARIMEKARTSMQGSYTPSCLAVIPVRESYPSLDGVPYLVLGGMSLLQRALESAQSARSVTGVAVSTSSESVLEFSRKLVQEGHVSEHLRISRPLQLSGSHIQLREILLHAANAYKVDHGSTPDITIFLNLHAPLRKAMHVDKALDTLLVTGADSVVSVCEEGEPIFSHGDKGLQLLNPGRFDDLILERERLYRFNGAVLAIWTEVLEADGVFGESIAYIEMSKEDSLQIKQSADLESLRSRFD